MKRAVLGAALALALVSCGSQPQAADGYVFGTPEYELTRIDVTIVQYDTQAEFLGAAKSHGADPERLEAFAILSRVAPRCEIHILRVATNYRPQWLGHELAHCMHGSWHE